MKLHIKSGNKFALVEQYTHYRGWEYEMEFDEYRITGTYRQKKDTLYFQTSGCDFDKGKYAYKIDGHDLYINCLYDSCEWRSNLLEGQWAWIRKIDRDFPVRKAKIEYFEN